MVQCPNCFMSIMKFHEEKMIWVCHSCGAIMHPKVIPKCPQITWKIGMYSPPLTMGYL